MAIFGPVTRFMQNCIMEDILFSIKVKCGNDNIKTFFVFFMNLFFRDEYHNEEGWKCG